MNVWVHTADSEGKLVLRPLSARRSTEGESVLQVTSQVEVFVEVPVEEEGILHVFLHNRTLCARTVFPFLLTGRRTDINVEFHPQTMEGGVPTKRCAFNLFTVDTRTSKDPVEVFMQVGRLCACLSFQLRREEDVRDEEKFRPHFRSFPLSQGEEIQHLALASVDGSDLWNALPVVPPFSPDPLELPIPWFDTQGTSSIEGLSFPFYSLKEFCTSVEVSSPSSSALPFVLSEEAMQNPVAAVSDPSTPRIEESKDVEELELIQRRDEYLALD